MSEPAKIAIRPLTPADWPLVFSSWIKAEKAANDKAWIAWRAKREGEPPISNSALCDGLHRRIEALLPRARVVGAVLPEDPDTILGFAVAGPDPAVLHWLSVKEAFRRHGIARAMLAHLSLLEKGATVKISSRTPTFAAFARHCGIKTQFDPFAMA